MYPQPTNQQVAVEHCFQEYCGMKLSNLLVECLETEEIGHVLAYPVKKMKTRIKAIEIYRPPLGEI
jgi:hypothetical protein